MHNRNLVGILTVAMSLFFATGLTGCSDDDGGNDNNNNDNENTTADHLSDEMLITVAGDPDFTCEGQVDPALSFTVETEISGIVRDFEEDWAVEGVLVSVYESVQDLLDDNPYDTSPASAPNGSYTVLAPPDVPRLHFKIWDPTFSDYFVTMELNEPVAGMPPGPPQTTGKDRLIISAVTMEVVPAILGIQRIAGRGIVSGRVYDCNRDELEHAAMRVYDGPASDPDRQLLSLYEGPQRNAFYFPAGGSIPGKDPMFTDPEGRFIVANLVATPGEFVTMEMWGRYAGCPDGCLVSTQDLPVLPDSIVVTDMLPLYAE